MSQRRTLLATALANLPFLGLARSGTAALGVAWLLPQRPALANAGSLLSTPDLEAQSPLVTDVLGGVLLRGSTTRLEVVGRNLAGSKVVYFSEPSIGCEIVERSETSLTLLASTPDDVEPGPLSLTVVTPCGSTDMSKQQLRVRVVRSYSSYDRYDEYHSSTMSVGGDLV